MKIQINPTRITLNEKNECPINLPKIKKSSKRKIEGGNLISPQRKKSFIKDQDMFLLVDLNGTPIQSSDKTTLKSYFAKKPSLAAVKAFYSIIRANDFSTTLMGGNIDTIQEEALKYLPKQEVIKYMEKVKHSRSEPPATIYLRRPTSNKILHYTVQYQRVLKPNRHEIEKGITKVAHAIRVI